MKYILPISILIVLMIFSITAAGTKIPARVQPSSATNTATMLIDMFKTYSFPSDNSEQGTCMEIRQTNSDKWLAITATNDLLVLTPGRCP